ncbi:hypothetical protein K3495_g3134 [Podosphaera aphanis]|nr:hypothetical protein K3495_g3134 [Podosphaera aphanis]
MSSQAHIDDGINKTQWGNVTVLTGENYTLFETQAKKALATAGCWGLIDGAEEEVGQEPNVGEAALYKKWERKFEAYEKKRENAIKIISTPIDDALVDDEVEAALRDGNPQDL